MDITIDLRRKLWGIKKMPLDLLTYNCDRFEKHAANDRSFENTIAREGVVLYEG
jgi:hypothetical protein